MPTPTTKIKGSNNYISLISFNINGINSPIKRHRLIDSLHKEDPTCCCLQETHLREKDRHYLRVKGWKTIFQANGLKIPSGVAILISNKIDFQPKVITKDKRHFLLIKGKIYQDELSILNIYVPNTMPATFICTSHNNSGRLQHPSLTNGQILETETKQRHMYSNKSYKTNGFNRYLQNILSYNKRIYLLRTSC